MSCEVLEWQERPSELGAAVLRENPDIVETLLPGVKVPDLLTERIEPAPVRGRAGPASVPEPAFVYEISTFVIEGVEIFGKATDQARREFVERRLLHRLPVLSIEEVERSHLRLALHPSVSSSHLVSPS